MGRRCRPALWFLAASLGFAPLRVLSENGFLSGHAVNSVLGRSWRDGRLFTRRTTVPPLTRGISSAELTAAREELDEILQGTRPLPDGMKLVGSGPLGRGGWWKAYGGIDARSGLMEMYLEGHFAHVPVAALQRCLIDEEYQATYDKYLVTKTVIGVRQDDGERGDGAAAAAGRRGGGGGFVERWGSSVRHHCASALARGELFLSKELLHHRELFPPWIHAPSGLAPGPGFAPEGAPPAVAAVVPPASKEGGCSEGGLPRPNALGAGGGPVCGEERGVVTGQGAAAPLNPSLSGGGGGGDGGYTEIIHHEAKYPKPLSNRDWVYYRRFLTTEEEEADDRAPTSLTLVQRDVEPEEALRIAPPVPGSTVVRAGGGFFYQRCLLRPETSGEEGGGCVLAIRSQDSLGGNVPFWVQNALARKGPPLYFRSLEGAAVALMLADKGPLPEKDTS